MPPLNQKSHALSTVEQKWLAKAYRFQRNGWLYLHIEGEPDERGFQHGYLMAPEIRDILKTNQFTTKWNTGEDFSFFSQAAEDLYSGLIDSEVRAEIKGIADGATKAGAPFTFAEALAWNSSFELLWNWWPSVKGKKAGGRINRHHHCSSFIASGRGVTEDGGIVLAHNSWDTFINSNAFRLMLDIVPSDGHRLLMQSAPGLIHSGTDFFITSGGLIGSETSIAGFSSYDPKQLPEFYRVRKAMQYTDTLDGWIHTMETRNNGGYANSWLVGDIKSGEIGRVELGLQYVGIQRTKNGSFWGCNLVEDPRIRNQECSEVDYSDITAHAGRRVRWEKLLEQNRGRINRDLAKKMIADHYDVAHGRSNPSTRSICGHFDEDASLFRDLNFGPFEPYGANDAKVTDSFMANNLSLLARYGRPCGQKFDAPAFLKKHPQYAWQADFLRSKPKQPWTQFAAGDMV